MDRGLALLSSVILLHFILYTVASGCGDEKKPLVVKCTKDACGRTPARTQPRPQTTASPPAQTASPVPVTPARSHRQQCTPYEIKKAACLNGECFSVFFGIGNRTALCECPDMYEGSRCERLSEDFFVLYAGEVKKAGIAAGVVIVVIILAIVFVYFVIKRRKRRKRAQERLAQEREAQLNGNAAQPLMKEAMANESIALNGMEKNSETHV